MQLTLEERKELAYLVHEVHEWLWHMPGFYAALRKTEEHEECKRPSEKRQKEINDCVEARRKQVKELCYNRFVKIMKFIEKAELLDQHDIEEHHEWLQAEVIKEQ